MFFKSFLQKISHHRWFAPVIDFVLDLVIVILLALLVKTFLFSFFWVSGESMIPSLQDKDLILINKIGYNKYVGDPKRGDIVVIIPPTNSEEYYVKRIIGLPKETVSLYDGDVSIEKPDDRSIKIDEEYLSKRNNGHTCPKPYANKGECGKGALSEPKEISIYEDRYFVMGDNRTSSTDSRSWNNSFGHNSGAVKRNALVGKAVLRIWIDNYIPHLELLSRPRYKSLGK